MKHVYQQLAELSPSRFSSPLKKTSLKFLLGITQTVKVRYLCIILECLTVKYSKEKNDTKCTIGFSGFLFCQFSLQDK